MTTPLRVLVVEDSEDDTLLQMRELRRGGFNPTSRRVQSAEELQAALQTESWELVLSDYALPGFTGLEALRIVQASGHDLPFLLISGTVGEEVAVQSMKAGAHDYLLKDNLTRLAPAVRRSLADAAERRQRRQAEAALRDSQSLLALIYDHTAEMLLLFALEGAAYRVASMNQAWRDFAARLGVPENGQRFLGLQAEEVIAALASGAGLDREIQEHFREACGCGGPVAFELQWQIGDEIVHTEQHFIPVADEQGNARHLLWAAHDATERKRAEERQRRLEARVAHAQKLEALGTLASGIAHDFNNILAGIAGYLDLVALDTREMPLVQESVRQIQGGVERATDLTRRILAFSRKRTVERRPMHLGPVVEEALAFLRPLIPPGVRVEKALDKTCPPVSADSGQIHQVLLNLATNAVHALEGRGGALTVSLARCYVDGAFAAAHPALRPGEHVLLAVGDTGCGMDDATLRRLFEPFFTTKPPGAGTGLGLAVVLDIVKAYQGAIVVRSAPGAGSTFELYFPVVEGPEAG
jgi:signal transduction histidine kinase